VGGVNGIIVSLATAAVTIIAATLVDGATRLQTAWVPGLSRWR